MGAVNISDALQSAFFAALAAGISTVLAQSDYTALAAVVATAPVRDFLTVFMSGREISGENNKLNAMKQQAADMVRGDVAVLVGTVLLWTLISGSKVDDVENTVTHVFIPATIGWLATACVLVLAKRL